MQPQDSRKYLRQSNRGLKILVGWACALISLVFAALLVFLAYVIVWRNPREYGSKDFFDIKVLALLAVLLMIAVGFSVLASRLLRARKPGQRLLSPLVLRIWGTFFFAGSVVMLVDGIIHRRWTEIPHLWEALAFNISMSIAAFVLAGTSTKPSNKTR